MRDVIVVGGGVIGCAVAYRLAREGASILLLEREDLAARASGAAAGMLTPIGEAGREGPLLDAGLASFDLFPELCAELLERSAVDPELVRSGVLRLALTEAEAGALAAQAARFAAHGLEWLDAATARAFEPALPSGIHGAVWSPREGHVRSPLLTRALALAARGLGARIEVGATVAGLTREGSRVTGVLTATGRHAAGHVVLCTGADSRACEAWLGAGVRLPVEPVRGQILSLDGRGLALERIVWGAGEYLVPKRDGRLVVGATTERVGHDCRVTAEGLRQLLDAARRLVPGIAECSFEGAWAGLRPDTPDHLPMIGPMPGSEGLAVACGHYRNGVLLAPITAELVARGILGKGWADAAAFDPGRFS